ncbi:hypothetical protein ROLI_010010 [Roseobacter fucihabitans]|uniref:Polymer-forming cytoskeletal protein n=1 Tax=Roseobacter fucihabitans TaxID=1537242 RepID=A0ABZ2BPK2_9RHOB|nr:polymer-forming cytoskeletal protein [Roseobacter litoralis]MBC6965371.1 Polymer-forming cytoskeletal [Roseobacter litoralis]MBC6965463.1 Polymer-forming cytoskeletal [Roseobacter litoralis]
MPNSVIAEDLFIEGNIKSAEGSVEIKGSVSGDITALSTVVRAGGHVQGALSGKTVVLEGRHQGTLQCDDLTLSATANVEANISAQTVTAQSGAEIDGAMHICAKA